MIEKGKITKPIKGATLVGAGREAMEQISMVGNDLNLIAGLVFAAKKGKLSLLVLANPH